MLPSPSSSEANLRCEEPASAKRCCGWLKASNRWRWRFRPCGGGKAKCVSALLAWGTSPLNNPDQMHDIVIEQLTIDGNVEINNPGDALAYPSGIALTGSYDYHIRGVRVTNVSGWGGMYTNIRHPEDDRTAPTQKTVAEIAEGNSAFRNGPERHPGAFADTGGLKLEDVPAALTGTAETP